MRHKPRKGLNEDTNAYVKTEGHENYVHHMVLYECHVSTTNGADSSEWFEHHVGGDGHACYSPNMPQEWSFCLATNAWAWVCLKQSY